MTDRFASFHTSMPVRLRRIAEAHAASRGLTLAAYLVQLVRADLEAAGVSLPRPPVRRSGPKAGAR